MAVSCLALTKNTATEIIGRPIVCRSMPPRGPLALRNDDSGPAIGIEAKITAVSVGGSTSGRRVGRNAARVLHPCRYKLE